MGGEQARRQNGPVSRYLKAVGLHRVAHVARAVSLEDSHTGPQERLFLEWNWAMFFPPDISHLGYRRTLRRSSEVLSATQPPARATKPASNA